MSGGAAFPSPGVVLKSKFDGDPYQQGAYEGMSLRDYFAAKAMQALNSGATPHDVKTSLDYVAEASYQMADAMLKARAA